MRQYFLQYVTNWTTNGCTCCNTQTLKRLQFKNFKKSMENVKMWNQHILYLERKAYGTTKSSFAPNIYLLSMN